MKESLKPKRKVTAAGLGGAVGIIAVWLIGFAVEVDPLVAGAFSTVAAFAAGYLVPEA